MPPYRQMFYQLCDLNVDEYVREGPRDAEVGTLGLGDRGVACSSRPARRGLCPGSRGPGSTFQAAVRASARGWVFAFHQSAGVEPRLLPPVSGFLEAVHVERAGAWLHAMPRHLASWGAGWELTIDTADGGSWWFS